MTGDWTISIWNKRGPNKTWSKPHATPSEKEITMINYFRVVDYIHPNSRRPIKVLSNWLPQRAVFNYDCFLYAAGFCLVIPCGNLIIAYHSNSYFFKPILLIFASMFRWGSFYVKNFPQAHGVSIASDRRVRVGSTRSCVSKYQNQLRCFRLGKTKKA